MNAKPKTELNSFVFIQKRCNVNGAWVSQPNKNLDYYYNLEARVDYLRNAPLQLTASLKKFSKSFHLKF